MICLLLLVLATPLFAHKSPDIQKLREAVVQLEQEIKLTSTHDFVKEKEESSFWPKCKFWMGLCVVTVVSQLISYSLQDKNQAHRGYQEKIERLTEMVGQLNARLEVVEGHSAEPELPEDHPTGIRRDHDEKR